MPDFYLLLNRQCELLVEGTGELLAFMNSSQAAHADRVIELERECEALKSQNMSVLHQAFATPFDREDINRSIYALDDIVNYLRSTVRELRTLQLGPDEHTCAMAALLHEGAMALQKGYASLKEQPLLAEADAETARLTERSVEHIYRAALSELFDVQHYIANLTSDQQEVEGSLDVFALQTNGQQIASVGSAVGFVLEILKRREVYRHMSNAADRVVHAGDVLHDIVAKIA